jgi:hypothetical protein
MHLARAYDANMSDTATDKTDDGPRRVLIRDRTLGARRRWVVRVPSGSSGAARRSPDSVVEVERGDGSREPQTRTSARAAPSAAAWNSKAF